MGKNVVIDSLDVSDFDLIVIGDGAVINEGATITGHHFTDGLLHFGAVLAPLLYVQSGTPCCQISRVLECIMVGVLLAQHIWSFSPVPCQGACTGLDSLGLGFEVRD